MSPTTRKGRKIQRFFVSSRRPARDVAVREHPHDRGDHGHGDGAGPRGCAISAHQPPQPQAASPMKSAEDVAVMSTIPHFGKCFMILELRTWTYVHV